MPPRNSNTKAFKKYERYPLNIEEEKAKHFTMEKIYGCILNPEDAIGNLYSKKFDEYKQKSQNDGIDLEVEFQKNIKDDMDGDNRYIFKDWYQKKIRG